MGVLDNIEHLKQYEVDVTKAWKLAGDLTNEFMPDSEGDNYEFYHSLRLAIFK
jgi:hypothetical protein